MKFVGGFEESRGRGTRGDASRVILIQKKRGRKREEKSKKETIKQRETRGSDPKKKRKGS